ncbi:MAG: hypothetical protein WDA27_12625 [Actinomycetota bacterium]
MATETVGFAIEEGDRPRLDHLVGRFGGGNRSQFLRVAMSYMEAADRAERLRALQAYGAEKSAARALSVSDIEAVVNRVLNKPAKKSKK